MAVNLYIFSNGTAIFGKKSKISIILHKKIVLYTGIICGIVLKLFT